METTKLPKVKYLRVHDTQLKEWILEIMKDEKMRFARANDVALEIQERYGGIASSHLNKIRKMRLNVQNFLPEEEKIRRAKIERM